MEISLPKYAITYVSQVTLNCILSLFPLTYQKSKLLHMYVLFLFLLLFRRHPLRQALANKHFPILPFPSYLSFGSC